MTSCTTIHVTIPGVNPARAEALADLDARLSALPAGFAEISVDHERFPALLVLVNGVRAWMMCMRYEGDAGFSSRNPDLLDDPSDVIEYVLSNGEQDAYPAAWAYPTPQVLEAVAFFARHRRMPEWIRWFNDSGDDNLSPNDPWAAPA